MPLSPLSQEQVEELLATGRATNDEDRELKQKMKMRVNARETTRREDSAIDDQVAREREKLENARRIIATYDRAIDESVSLLGDDHKASMILREA
jgi:molecular chaperone DnaK (HSP70)